MASDNALFAEFLVNRSKIKSPLSQPQLDAPRATTTDDTPLSPTSDEEERACQIFVEHMRLNDNVQEHTVVFEDFLLAELPLFFAKFNKICCRKVD